MDKKFIADYDYNYVLTATSTDVNIVNVAIYRFNNETIHFTIPHDEYDNLDSIIMRKMIMDFRKKKLIKIKSRWEV